jgi:hypothetical protein
MDYYTAVVCPACETLPGFGPARIARPTFAERFRVWVDADGTVHCEERKIEGGGDE